MTDEQYIEKLMNKGFEQREINQLLKIYIYTKKYDFVLENIDLNIDNETLREIASFLRKEELDQNYFDLLKKAQEKDCNIVPYLLDKYNHNALQILINFEAEGHEIDNLKNPKFTAPSRLKYIDAFAFFRTGLKTLTLNENLEYIDNSAFKSCNLRNISMHEKVKYHPWAFKYNDIFKIKTVKKDIKEDKER